MKLCVWTRSCKSDTIVQTLSLTEVTSRILSVFTNKTTFAELRSEFFFPPNGQKKKQVDHVTRSGGRKVNKYNNKEI